MSREKKIEELNQDLLRAYGTNKLYSEDVAEYLYNAGYRKQSEGEWVAYPDEHEICATEFVCSNCKESFCTNEMTDWEFIETMKYCPNCGAKMKGGE